MKPFYFLLIYLSSFNLFSQSLNIDLLDNWKDESIENDYMFGGAFNEVWGFVQDNQEYAVIGSTAGSHFFKITNEDSLELIHFVEGRSNGPGIIHRDYHDFSGYLYEVCQEGPQLRIYDLQYLPDSLPIVYDTSNVIQVSHNIFIDSLNKKLYSCINNNGTSGSSLSIFSLSTPLEPTLLQEWHSFGEVHDLYVKNDTAFLNNANSGLTIVNFFANNSSGIDPIADIPFYNDQGYNHSGWVSDDGKTYIFCDETPGMRFKVCDITDIENIEIIAYDKPNTFETTISHNVIIKDNFAYFSYYFDGLQVYDISNPYNPIRVAYYDTFLGNDDTDSTIFFGGAWGVYPLLPSGRILVSDRQNGLFLLENTLITNTNNSTIKDNTKIHLTYPNPITDILNIEFTTPILSKYQLQIYDSKGNLIESIYSKEQILILNVQSYAKGNYSYRININNTITNGQFIKI
jgi:choice-of-anchor B domain-containing protein